MPDLSQPQVPIRESQSVRTKNENRPIRVDVKLSLNAVEVVFVDKLLDSGIYGESRGAVVRRIVDIFIEERTRRQKCATT